MIDRQQINYTPKILKKSNLLIEKSNELDFCIQKILNTVLFEVQNQPINNTNFKIHNSQITNCIGEKPVHRTINFFDNIGRKLIRHIVDLIDKTDNELDLTNLITRFKLENGYINFKVTDECKSLTHLDFTHKDGTKTINKGYTKVNLDIVGELKKHSIPLYEFGLMKHCYITSPKHIKDKSSSSFYLELDKLRLLLCKNSKSYLNNTNLFIFKLLKPAIADVNKTSDIYVSYEVVKGCDNKTIIGFDFTIKLKEEYNAAKKEKSLIQSIIQPVKDIFKTPEKKPQLAAQKEAENLPEPIAQAKEWGYKNINQLMQTYNSSLDKKRQILAILAEISFKYSDKPNDEKCRLIASLIKINACYKSTVEIEQEDKKRAQEMQEKQQAQAYKQKQEHEQQQKAQKAKAQSEENLQKYSKIYNALDKTEQLNILTHSARNCALPLNKYIEDDKFKDFNNFSIMYKTAIVNYFKQNPIYNGFVHSQEKSLSKEVFASVESVINDMLGEFILLK